MDVIIIDALLLGIMICMALAFGVQLTEILSDFTLKYQTPIICFIILAVFIMNMMIVSEIGKRRGKYLLAVINTIIDSFLQVGFIVVTFTYIQLITSHIKTQFFLMIFLLIPGLCEFLLFSGLSFCGSSIFPYIVNKWMAIHAENKNIGSIIGLMIYKIILSIVFLWACRYFVTNYWPDSYNAIFGNTVFNSVLSLIPFNI